KCYFLNILGHFYPFFFNTTYRMAAFAAVSFAEGITFGAWLRALAAPVASDGDETITAAGNSWGYGARTARINVSAVAPDGNAGFNMGVYNDVTMSLSAGDEANLWVKPLDIVKVSYGKYDNNTLRGDLCYGSWNWLRPTSSWIAEDEGLLMSGNGGTGLMAEITPMEELYIQVMAPITTEQVKAGTTYKNLRAGFAYTVPGTVKVKGQYIGKGAASQKEGAKVNGKFFDDEEKFNAAISPLYDALADKDVNGDGTIDDDDFDEFVGTLVEDGTVVPVAEADGNSNCTLEAEVDVLAVEGLFAGVGFQYNVIKDGKDNSPDAVKTKIALGASYQVMPELKVSASGAFFMYYGDKVDPRWQAGLGVDYDLGDGLAVNADARYLAKSGYDGTKADNSDHLAFSVGVTKSVSSNGYIGVAFQGQTNSGTFANTVIPGQPNDDLENKNFTWAIPVALSVWF
ncbi:MAG TPA: hypothetical protein DCZ76_09145, partial [Treponema sp.]|nr:hypothetical protein [Treponema sp.]